MIKRGHLEETEADQSIDDIVQATVYEVHDGYKIAKRLEDRFYWDSDMQVAEDMDQFDSILHDVHRAAEAVWAAENPSEPKFADGDTVTWRGIPATVHGICDYRPQCYEVTQGEMKWAEVYFVVPFEEVSAP